MASKAVAKRHIISQKKMALWWRFGFA